MPFVHRASYQPAFAISPIPGYRVGLIIGQNLYVGQVVYSEISRNQGEIMTLQFANGRQKHNRALLVQLANQQTEVTIAPPV